jgi:hypothetical protein
MIGKGSRLYYSTNGTTYTELTNLVEMGSPDSGSPEQIDETPLNPTNSRREYVPGLIDTTVFPFKQYWNKTRYALLLPYISNGITLYWRVTSPDNATPANASRWDFQGNLKKWMAPEFKVTTSLIIDAEVQITGDITFTQGS